jgi:hypothetical protein
MLGVTRREWTLVGREADDELEWEEAEPGCG